MLVNLPQGCVCRGLSLPCRRLVCSSASFLACELGKADLPHLVSSTVAGRQANGPDDRVGQWSGRGHPGAVTVGLSVCAPLAGPGPRWPAHPGVCAAGPPAAVPGQVAQGR